MKTIRLDKTFFETCGTNSLEGLLVSEGATEPQPILLLFPQTSLGWRQGNNGPDLYIVPEFVPMVLIDSILWMIRKGYTISTEFVTE